jgi:hypothetical protein
MTRVGAGTYKQVMSSLTPMHQYFWLNFASNKSSNTCSINHEARVQSFFFWWFLTETSATKIVTVFKNWKDFYSI